MDKAFLETCARIVPPMNEQFMNGYLIHEIYGQGSGTDEQQRRVDETTRRAFDGRFNGRLRVGDMVQCSSHEAYMYAIKPKNTERSFELAPSDVYLVRQPLYFDDQHLVDIHTFLLAPEIGALARLSRTYYSFRPTISDKVISPENRLIFVRLDQYRMNLMQLSHPILVNYRPVMEAEVAWGQIHKSSKEKKAGIKTKAKSCLVHYLLGHYGFTEMFKKYVGYVPIYGDSSTITEEKYPLEDWFHIRTAHKTTRAVSCTENEHTYKATDLVIVVPKEQWTTKMKAFVMSVFYIVDSFPSIMHIDKMEHKNSWRLTLGHILFSPALTVQRILSQVEEHFNSSDTYMDSESIIKLRQNGHHVNDFHDLLALLAGQFTELLETASTGTLYGKYLDTLRDVIDPIIKSINNTKYELLELELKNQATNSITSNKIKDCIVRSYRTGAIFDNCKANHLVEVVASSTDHPYFKMTSRLGTSDRSPNGKKGKLVLNERHWVNTAKMMVGSVLNLSKQLPILEGHGNPWMILDLATGTIQMNPLFADELAEVDAKLNKKLGRN